MATGFWNLQAAILPTKEKTKHTMENHGQVDFEHAQSVRLKKRQRERPSIAKYFFLNLAGLFGRLAA